MTLRIFSNFHGSELSHGSSLCDSVTSKVIKPTVVSRNLQVRASCRESVSVSLPTSASSLSCVTGKRLSYSPIYIMMLLLCYISSSLNHPEWKIHFRLSAVSSVTFASGVSCFRVIVSHPTPAKSRNSLILNSGQKPFRECTSPKSKPPAGMQDPVAWKEAFHLLAKRCLYL